MGSQVAKQLMEDRSTRNKWSPLKNNFHCHCNERICCLAIEVGIELRAENICFSVFIHKTVDFMIGKDKISNCFSLGNVKQK